MFEDLNPEQLSAVLHGEGPLLIVAGAGSGKTLTLAARVASLTDRGTRPERILLLTFSRRAAREMVSRAQRLVAADAGHVWSGTFHAIGNRLMRIHGRALGLSPRLHGPRPGRRRGRDEPAPRRARVFPRASAASRARTRWRRSTRGP